MKKERMINGAVISGIIILALFGFVGIIAGCCFIAPKDCSILHVKENPSETFSRETKLNPKAWLVVKTDRELPYYASPERLQQIKDGIKRIKEGMAKDEILKIMGEPDIVASRYAKNNYSRRDGYYFCYWTQELPPGENDQRRVFESASAQIDFNFSDIAVHINTSCYSPILHVKENSSEDFSRALIGKCPEPWTEVITDRKILHYTSPERDRQIEAGMKMIKEGVSKDEILKIMGEPNVMSFRYIKNENNDLNKIDSGYRYYYFVQQLLPMGINQERKARVCIDFNCTDTAIQICTDYVED